MRPIASFNVFLLLTSMPEAFVLALMPNVRLFFFHVISGCTIGENGTCVAQSVFWFGALDTVVGALSIYVGPLLSAWSDIHGRKNLVMFFTFIEVLSMCGLLIFVHHFGISSGSFGEPITPYDPSIIPPIDDGINSVPPDSETKSGSPVEVSQKRSLLVDLRLVAQDHDDGEVTDASNNVRADVRMSGHYDVFLSQATRQKLRGSLVRTEEDNTMGSFDFLPRFSIIHDYVIFGWKISDLAGLCGFLIYVFAYSLMRIGGVLSGNGVLGSSIIRAMVVDFAEIEEREDNELTNQSVLLHDYRNHGQNTLDASAIEGTMGSLTESVVSSIVDEGRGDPTALQISIANGDHIQSPGQQEQSLGFQKGGLSLQTQSSLDRDDGTDHTGSSRSATPGNKTVADRVDSVVFADSNYKTGNNSSAMNGANSTFQSFSSSIGAENVSMEPLSGANGNVDGNLGPAANNNVSIFSIEGYLSRASDYASAGSVGSDGYLTPGGENSSTEDENDLPRDRSKVAPNSNGNQSASVSTNVSSSKNSGSSAKDRGSGLSGTNRGATTAKTCGLTKTSILKADPKALAKGKTAARAALDRIATNPTLCIDQNVIDIGLETLTEDDEDSQLKPFHHKKTHEKMPPKHTSTVSSIKIQAHDEYTYRGVPVHTKSASVGVVAPHLRVPNSAASVLSPIRSPKNVALIAPRDVNSAPRLSAPISRIDRNGTDVHQRTNQRRQDENENHVSEEKLMESFSQLNVVGSVLLTLGPLSGVFFKEVLGFTGIFAFNVLVQFIAFTYGQATIPKDKVRARKADNHGEPMLLQPDSTEMEDLVGGNRNATGARNRVAAANNNTTSSTVSLCNRETGVLVLVCRNSILLCGSIITLVLSFCEAGIVGAIQYYTVDIARFSDRDNSLLFLFMGISAGLFSYLIGKISRSSHKLRPVTLLRIGILGNVLHSIMFLLAGLVHPIWMRKSFIYFAEILVGLTLQVSTTLSCLIAEVSPPQERAKYQAIVTAVGTIGSTLGPLILGYAFSVFQGKGEMYVPFVICAAVVFVSLFATLKLNVTRGPL